MSGQEGPETPAKKPATKAAVGAGFFIVAAIVCALLTVVAVNIAIHPQGAGNTRASGIAGTVIFFAFFCLFAHLALQAEHHWHWHRQGGQSADPVAQLAEAQAVSAPPKVSAVGKNHQRHGPVGAAVLGVILLLVTVFSFVFLFQSISGANRSHEVQKHGVRANVTVVSIHHEQHSSRY